MNERQREEISTAEIRCDGQKFLIVGLGNPGRKFQANRHNVGFMTVSRLAQVHDIKIHRIQNKALIGDGRISNCAVILAKPQTFMNLSGESVAPLAAYYRISPVNMLVVYDDLDLPLGTIRLRENGGAGGHNGMKSIIQHVGTNFPRLRLGIGRPSGRMPPAAYVLRDFDQDEQSVVDDVIEEALRAIVTFLKDGIDLAMSRHNKTLINEGSS